MILKEKSNFYQVYKILSLLIFTNISNLYANNLYNGGCQDHCGQLFEAIIHKNRFNNLDNKWNIENKNSCLKKSLCRG